MKLLREIIYWILSQFIHFLIDFREVIDDTPVICLRDVILNEWGETKYCPWCDGIGLLTKDGKPIREVI